jgi:hypothetical protein
VGFPKKTEYESIYNWVNSNTGNCFYCKKDNNINIKLIGEKDICDECASTFVIGHIGADWHAIGHLATELRTHEQAKEWLEKH